jgi:hypothetical protein
MNTGRIASGGYPGFQKEGLITQRSRVQIPPPQPLLPERSAQGCPARTAFCRSGPAESSSPGPSAGRPLRDVRRGHDDPPDCARSAAVRSFAVSASPRARAPAGWPCLPEGTISTAFSEHRFGIGMRTECHAAYVGARMGNRTENRASRLGLRIPHAREADLNARRRPTRNRRCIAARGKHMPSEAAKEESRPCGHEATAPSRTRAVASRRGWRMD